MASQNFLELERSIAGLPTPKARGDAFEDFVRSFLLLSPEFAMEAVWRLSEAPSDVLLSLGVPRRDIGIDLVGRRADGAIWVVQVKYRTDRGAVSWRELSTFVGAGEGAAHRLLVSNCVELPRNRPELDHRSFGAVLGGDLVALDPDFFDRLAQFRETRCVIPPARKVPRPDQRDAVQALAECFRSGETRVQFVAACGTGKTLTALWLTEAIGASRAIVFCPSLALVHQTLKAWTDQSARRLESLVVCSDHSVGDVKPSEVPVPVRTVPDEVRLFWTRASELPRVVFATYQSLDAVHEALKGGPDADLLVADEAHRIAGREGKAYQGVLRDAVIPAKRRLFMTATPRICGPSVAAGRSGNQIVVSMDDDAAFGRVGHSISFGKAIELGLLADYQVQVLAVSDSQVRELVSNRCLVAVADRSVEAETLAQAVAIESAMNRGVIRRAFTFHHTVDGARRFAWAFGQLTMDSVGPRTYVGLVRGEMSVGARRRVLAELETSRTGLVCSARALSEGVDVPSVDGVVFVDPKSSVVDIVQAVGRALRRDHAKPEKRAQIVIPVVVGDGEDPDSELSRSAWEPVWRVLNALRAHDEILAAHLDAETVALGRRGTAGERECGLGDSSLGGRLILTLPPEVDLQRFRECIGLRVIEHAADTFWAWYGRLLEYRAKFGDCQVPNTYEDKPLATFVNRQRRLKRLGRLLPERQVALSEVGFSWEPRSSRHADYVSRIADWIRRNGSGNVPSILPGEPDLGHAVQNYRGKWNRNQLESDLEHRLRSVGFVFNLEDHNWQTVYQAVVSKLAARRPLDPKENNWLNYQQARWRRGVGHADGELRPQRAVALKAIGMGPRRERDGAHSASALRLRQRCAELVEFHARHGHANVRRSDSASLYGWLRAQLTRMKLGKQVPVAVLDTLRQVGIL